MPLKAKANAGGDFSPVPAGTHHAVCYGVVDLGTQPSGNPQNKDRRKVAIIWELPDERGVFPDPEDRTKSKDLPRAVSAQYTLSLGEMAHLRKILESWRARQFTAEELEGFDVSRLIGANCMLTVVHKKGTGVNASKTYANVAGVSSLPKALPKKNPENATLYFSLEDIPEGEPITFPANMPDWIKAKIANSAEFIRRAQEGGHPAEAEEEKQEETVDEDLSVPF